jgi:F-type H+-transporting ATPase subunit delta
MFHADRWAEAFVNSCNDHDPGGVDAETGLAGLRAFAPGIAGIPGNVSGSVAAVQLDRMLHKVITKAGGTQDDSGAQGLEYAVRLLVLLVRKGFFHYISMVITEIGRILDEQRAILRVTVESAGSLDDSLQKQLETELGKRYEVRDVILTIRIVPELLGGCRLRVGSECWDASLRGQIQKMARNLQGAGMAASFDGQTSHGGMV